MSCCVRFDSVNFTESHRKCLPFNAMANTKNSPAIIEWNWFHCIWGKPDRAGKKEENKTKASTRTNANWLEWVKADETTEGESSTNIFIYVFSACNKFQENYISWARNIWLRFLSKLSKIILPRPYCNVGNGFLCLPCALTKVAANNILCCGYMYTIYSLQLSPVHWTIELMEIVWCIILWWIFGTIRTIPVDIRNSSKSAKHHMTRQRKCTDCRYAKRARGGGV